MHASHVHVCASCVRVVCTYARVCWSAEPSCPLCVLSTEHCRASTLAGRREIVAMVITQA